MKRLSGVPNNEIAVNRDDDESKQHIVQRKDVNCRPSPTTCVDIATRREEQPKQDSQEFASLCGLFKIILLLFRKRHINANERRQISIGVSS